MSGYPGLVESLTGQDVESDEQAEAADPYNAVLDAYESVVELSGEVDESEALLRSTGLSGSAEERAEGRDDHEALSIKVNLEVYDFLQSFLKPLWRIRCLLPLFGLGLWSWARLRLGALLPILRLGDSRRIVATDNRDDRMFVEEVCNRPGKPRVFPSDNINLVRLIRDNRNRHIGRGNTF